MVKMFEKILIANRGEIARRIIRTCKKMGIKSVAIYSSADKDALFVKEADEAFYIGGAPSNESYLCGDKIIKIALQSGAEAIHPGYGFLSENYEFAQKCMDSGLIFIGPPVSAIKAMALKGSAKAIMDEASVPTTPGYHGDAQDLETLKLHAQQIGYPILIKAVAGGGGKGMRLVEHDEDFAIALIAAQREGKNSFSNPKVLIEKYITKPRHVEIQIFGDRFGNIVHLYERDCSMQRRHQKIIEEAPAPFLTDITRQEMCEAAIKAAKAINYVGAGTIEFILDVSNGVENAKFYFMEMNTRLQVEHPITEEITGIDLVEWQLKIAAGEKLPKSQNEIGLSGHAIEVRLYAEDPNNDFLPVTGKLEELKFANNARIETAVKTNDEIKVFYDPMIAKIIVSGKNRQEAIAKMRNVLIDTKVKGLKTNLGFLRRLISNNNFIEGDIDTGLIGRNLEDLLLEWDDFEIAENIKNQDPNSPWNDNKGFWNNLGYRSPLALVHIAQDHEHLGTGEIISPMPGKIISLMVENGDVVSKGQALLIMEAMKMEHTIKADIDGTITNLSMIKGQQISEKIQILQIKGNADD